MCRPPTFGLNRSLKENDLARMIGVVLREADDLCVSRIARVFDRRVVQSILRKPVTARRTCAFSSRKVLIAATRLSLRVRSRSASIPVWKQ